MSGHQKIIALQLISTNTKCFYKIIVAKFKIISFECFVNSIIYFQKFQQYLYITKLSVMSCIENKSTQIIFKQGPHSNII